MYRSIGARSYLDSILKVEPQRPKPVPRGGKKKKKKAKKPKRSEIERLKERYGKDFILSLLLMILKGKTPGEKKQKKEKKGRKMKRAKGGEFISKKALARQRETARKAAIIEKARQPQPGDTPESIKRRVLETTLSQNDPTGQLGLIYQLTGGFNLNQGNYKGKDLRGSVAYIGRLVKELEKIDTKEQQSPGDFSAEDALRRRGLEQEALRTIYQFRGEAFDKIYAPTGKGRKSKAVAEGVKTGGEFITKLYQQIADEDDLEVIRQAIQSEGWENLVSGAATPDIKPKDKVDLFTKPPVVPVEDTDVDLPSVPAPAPETGPTFVKEGDKKSGRKKGKPFTEEKQKPAPGSAPTSKEIQSIPVEERYLQGKLTRKEFADILTINDKLEYLERISAEAPDGLRRSDALFKGWLDDDGFPITPKDIYEDYYLKYHPEVSEELPPQARIPQSFFDSWKDDRYRINNLLGTTYYKAIEEYLGKLLSFGFNSVEDIPDEYVSGFTLPSGVRGRPRQPARPDFIKSLVQEQREPEPQTPATTFDPAPPPAPTQPPFPTIEARDTDEGTSSESDVPPPPKGASPAPGSPEGFVEKPDPPPGPPPTGTPKVRKGRGKDKQKEIEDKTKEYTEKVNKLNLNIITQFGLDVDKEKDEILQRLITNINQETSSNQRGKLNRQLQKLTDRLLTGKSNIGFGIAQQQGLETKKKPKLSTKTRLQKVKDDEGNVIFGSYKDTQTGEVYNLQDFYPEYEEYTAQIKSGKKGSKKFNKLLKQLDDDFLWSLNDEIRDIDDLGKSGYTDDTSISSIEGAENKFGFKIDDFYNEPTDPRRIQGEVVGAGPKGITIRNQQGYLRFIDFSKEKKTLGAVPPTQPTEQTSGTDTSFIPDVEKPEDYTLFTPEGDYVGPTGFTSEEAEQSTPFGGKYMFSSTTDPDEGLFIPGKEELKEIDAELKAKRKFRLKQKKLKSAEQRKAAEERRQKRQKEFKEELDKKQLLQPPPEPGATQTFKLSPAPKIEEQQFSETDSGKEQEFILGGEELKGKKITADTTKLKKLEKELEEKKEVVKKRGKKATRRQLGDVGVAQKRVEKEKQKLAKLEEQIKKTTAQSLQRYNIEDTYGLYSETDSSDTGAVRRIPIRNPQELDERVKQKIAKGDFKQRTATRVAGYTDEGKVNAKGHKLRTPIIEEVKIGPSVEQQAQDYKSNFFLETFSQEAENVKRKKAGQRLLPGPILTDTQEARKRLKQEKAAYKEQMRKIYEGGEEYAGKLVAGLEQVANVPIAGLKATGRQLVMRRSRARDPNLTPADRIFYNIRALRTREEKDLANKIYSDFADKLLTKEKRDYTAEEEDTIQTEIDLATKQLRKSEAERKKALKKSQSPADKALEKFNKEFKGLYDVNKDAYFKRRAEVIQQANQPDAEVELDGGSAVAETKVEEEEEEEESDLTDTSIQTAIDAANIVGDADFEV